MKQLAERFATVFEDRCTVAEEPEEDWLRIHLEPDAKLTPRGPYNSSEKDRQFINTVFDKLHTENKLNWSKGSPIAWLVFVVWKNGKGRVAVDIRGLNDRALPDAYPMPQQKDFIQCLHNKNWLTKLDLSAAFSQRRVAQSEHAEELPRRMVVRRFEQTQDIDFDETCAGLQKHHLNASKTTVSHIAHKIIMRDLNKEKVSYMMITVETPC